MTMRPILSGLIAAWMAFACVLPIYAAGESDNPTSSSKSPELMIQEASTMLEDAKALLAEAKAAESANAESVGKADANNSAPGGFSRFDALIAGLSIFVLAVFVGFEVITKVPPTLHTPLMSGSNAISGITVVGALLVAGRSDNRFAWLLGLLAVVFAMINVIGGFWVTHRMLSMFKR